MPLSDELRDLYQQVILDHSKNPRNRGEIPPPCLHAHGDNPSCGDEIDVWLRLADNGLIEDLKFTGQGCAITTRLVVPRARYDDAVAAVLHDYEEPGVLQFALQPFRKRRMLIHGAGSPHP